MQWVGSLCEEPLTPWSEPACQVSAVELYRFAQLYASLKLNPANSIHAPVLDSLMRVGRIITRLRTEDLEAERKHQQRLREAATEREQAISHTRADLHNILGEIKDRRNQLMHDAHRTMSPSAVDAAKARLDQQAQWAGQAIEQLRKHT
ncbi:MAG: hypothetical protein AAGA29_06860 [Planctomycetota bacterium]